MSQNLAEHPIQTVIDPSLRREPTDVRFDRVIEVRSAIACGQYDDPMYVDAVLDSCIDRVSQACQQA